MSGIKVEFVAFAAPTPRAFSAWLRGADRGAVLPYHRGFLAVDVDTGAPGRSAHARQMLLEVADLARLASDGALFISSRGARSQGRLRISPSSGGARAAANPDRRST